MKGLSAQILTIFFIEYFLATSQYLFKTFLSLPKNILILYFFAYFLKILSSGLFVVAKIISSKDLEILVQSCIFSNNS